METALVPFPGMCYPIDYTMNFEHLSQPPFESRELKRLFPVSTIELIGKRSRQEDGSGTVEFDKDGNRLLAAAVADGHGSIGKHAAKTAVAEILKSLQEHGADDQSLEEAFARIHETVIKMNVFGGTTLSAALVKPGLITLAWVGNSQARLFSADDDTLHTLTLPHEYGAHPDETDRLVKQHVMVVDPKHPYARPKKHGHIAIPGGGRIEVSRSLGDPDFEPLVLHEPEIKTVVPTPADRYLVMASDGLWQCIDRHSRRKKVEQALAEAKDTEEAKTKIESLLAKWQPDDNTTVVIVDIKKP